VQDRRREVVCPVEEVSLRGRHNLYNVLAACAITAELGVASASMKKVATTFQGVEHRLEPAGEHAGVLYVNASIATSPERSMAGVEAFDRPIVLLAGGRDKHLPWEPWADLVVRKARALVAFGEARDLILRAVMQAWERAEGAGEEMALARDRVHQRESMEQALMAAAGIAQPGDVVLLSPGGTSFDAYVDFADRGVRFKELVRTLR